MSFIPTIPKFAFGTAFDLLPDCDTSDRSTDSDSDSSNELRGSTPTPTKPALGDVPDPPGAETKAGLQQQVTPPSKLKTIPLTETRATSALEAANPSGVEVKEDDQDEAKMVRRFSSLLEQTSPEQQVEDLDTSPSQPAKESSPQNTSPPHIHLHQNAPSPRSKSHDSPANTEEKLPKTRPKQQSHCDTTQQTKETSPRKFCNNEEKEKRLSKRQFTRLIEEAVRIGIRHFDCAPIYKTQPIVGQVLGYCIRKLSIPRQNFFITSKLPPNMMRPENIERCVKRSIEELQVNYLDCLLIHAPFSTKHTGDDDDFYPLDPDTDQVLLDDEEGENLLEKTWMKLKDLKRKGLTRYIGLSNVNLDQLIKLNELSHVDVVQNEYHIYLQDRELFDFCEENDIHFEAYAAFGSPMRAKAKKLPCVMNDPMVNSITAKNNLTVPQVIMHWIHQQPLSYVIRSDSIKQLRENYSVCDCVPLNMNDLIDLDTLNRNVRLYLFDEHNGLYNHTEYPFKGKFSEPEIVPDDKHLELCTMGVPLPYLLSPFDIKRKCENFEQSITLFKGL